MVGLGDRARDMITGFEGICVARTIWLFGNTRVGLQNRELKDGAPTEMSMFDDNQLIVLEEKAVTIAKQAEQKVQLGDYAFDMITRFQGYCVARTEWLFGCSRVGLQNDEMKDGVPNEPQWFDENQLKVKHENPLKIDNEKQEDSRKRGGPRPTDKGHRDFVKR